MLGNIDSYVRYTQIPFNDARDVFQVSHGSLMACYLGDKDLERHAEEGVLFLNRESSKQYIFSALAQCKNHQDFFKRLESLDVQDASNEVLSKFWRELIDNYSHSVAYFRSTQEEASRAIVKRVKEVFSEEEADLLMLSAQLDEINREEVAWELAITDGFDEERAMKHLQQFPWLFQNSLRYEDTVAELRQRHQGHVTRDIQKEKDDLHKKQLEVMSKHPEYVDIVSTLHELALLRPEVKAAWGSTGYYAKKLLDEIAKRFSIDVYVLTFFYRSEDVERLLDLDTVLSEKEIADRKLSTAYILKDGVLNSVVGQEALELEKLLLPQEKNIDTLEIKGQCARKGQVTGRIRILKINDPEATKEFRDTFDNEILVTSMTQPNIVDIARKAKAIITDEGGMLCHAAIISREFGIPCVVGTRNATEVLKDNDLVEVNADTGLIKIIERE